MKKSLHSGINSNIEKKNFNKKIYDNLIENYLAQIDCDGQKCKRFLEFKKSLSFIVSDLASLYAQIDEDKTAYVAIVHDIKSPALGIKLALEGVKRNSLEEEIYKICLNIIESIQTFLTNNTIKSTPCKVEICQMVLKVAQIYSPLFKKRGLFLSLNFSEDIFIFVQKAALGRILSNLFSNAAKYAKPNSTVSCSIIKDDSQCVFCIENMTDSKVSDEFSFGLGLEICKKLAKTANIDFYSHMNKKTALFRLKIPI